jgi:hypothetical protein
MRNKRFRCRIGLHVWSAWTYKSVNRGYYDFEEWFVRKCQWCGKIEEKDKECLLNARVNQ